MLLMNCAKWIMRNYINIISVALTFLIEDVFQYPTLIVFDNNVTSTLVITLNILFKKNKISMSICKYQCRVQSLCLLTLFYQTIQYKFS